MGDGQNLLDHKFDLFFGGVAGAGEGAFDLIGGVFEEGFVAFCGGEGDDASALGDLEGGFYIFGEKEFFEGDFINLVGGDESGKAIEDDGEAFREGEIFGGFDDAKIEGGKFAIFIFFNNAKAH